MALVYDGTTIPATGIVKYNGTSLTKIIYDGTTVWNKVGKYLFNKDYVSGGITSFSEVGTSGSLGKFTLTSGSYLQIQSGWVSGQSLGNIEIISNNFSKGSYTKLYYNCKSKHDTLSTTKNCYSNLVIGSKTIDMLPSTKNTWETFSGYIDISSMSSSLTVTFEHDCGIYGDTSPVYSYIRLYELYLV